MTQSQMQARRDLASPPFDNAWWLGTTTPPVRPQVERVDPEAPQTLHPEQLQALVHDELVATTRPDTWLRAATVGAPATAATPPIERQVLLRPAGRREGLVGLVFGLILVGLPVAGAIALGAWQAPPKQAETSAPVAAHSSSGQLPPRSADRGQVATTNVPPVASSTSS
jgi:hypothetical protein